MICHSFLGGSQIIQLNLTVVERTMLCQLGAAGFGEVN